LDLTRRQGYNFPNGLTSTTISSSVSQTLHKSKMTNENETLNQTEVTDPPSQPKRDFSRDHSEPPPLVHDCSTDQAGMRRCKSFWEQRVENHQLDRLINPFSDFWGDNRNKYKDTLENAKAVWKGIDKRTRLTKADNKYGMVVEGTLTDKRGKKAKDFIAGNIVECCETIKSIGTLNPETGLYEVSFGKMFRTYERINDKMVGLLIRARRHGLVDFPGEMLYQGQDNDVPIKLLKIPTVAELELKYITFQKPEEETTESEENVSEEKSA